MVTTADSESFDQEASSSTITSSSMAQSGCLNACASYMLFFWLMWTLNIEPPYVYMSVSFSQTGGA